MKQWLEVQLLRIAAHILDRNVKRSPVISRRDNNWLFDVVFELRAIASRIEQNYGTEP